MRILPVVVVIASNWCVPVAATQTVPQSKPTPGTVALLVEPKDDADVRMLATAVGDADPAVRAVAARIAGLLNRKDLAIALLDLLEREQDLTAASEQVRALLYLQGVEVLPQARAAAARLGAAVSSPLAEWLARTLPEQFAAAIPDLLRDIPEADRSILASIAAMAVRQTPGARDRIAASLAGAASGPAWRVFIDRLTVDATIITKGLASPTPAVREATIWFVVSDARAGRAIRAADLKSAMNSAQATPPTDETEWGAFGRELIARRFGKSDLTDGSSAIRRHALKNRSDASALVSGSKLTNDERSALREVLPSLFSDRAVKPRQPADPLEAEANPALLPTRTFPSVAPGLFTSLLEALGCTPPSDPFAFGAARILYQLDGRPSALAGDTRTLPKACVPFIGYLARLTVSQPDQPVLNGIPQWLFMAMDKDAVACAEEGVARSSSSRVAEPVAAGRISVPHKTKDVRPVYPQSMQRARISGTVIIQARITATGCIAGAEVLRSVELPLDLAAMRAVSGWRFEPARLDGKPVPVTMTVTVSFGLQ